jgi:YjbE family integral membrane protein
LADNQGTTPHDFGAITGMSVFDLQFWLLLLQIMAVNLILSGDNAVVIALACRNLPPRQQKWGIFFGAGAAVVLLVLFAVFVSYLLAVPFLHIFFGGLLLWIAYKLMAAEEDANEVEAADSLWHAIRIIAIADVVMSFDNIVAVAAVANGNVMLMVIGLAISIPMVVYGAALLIRVLQRFPVIVPAAAALIGFVGGEVMLDDAAWKDWIAGHAAWAPELIPLVSAIAVVLAGRMVAPQAEPPGRTAIAEEAVGAALLLALRAVLARAPLIIAFIVSAAGYTVGASVESATDIGGSALSAVRPIFGAVIAIGIADVLARLIRRASPT